MEKVSILYAAVQYKCQYMANVYILMFRNSLSLPSMENNTILPFIMREVDLVVRDTEKKHAMDPFVENHSIYIFRLLHSPYVFLHDVSRVDGEHL